MNQIKIIALLICLIVTPFLHIACVEKHKDLIVPERIDFSDDLLQIDSEYKRPFCGVNAKVKLLVSFDSLVCGPCSVRSLKNWTDIIEFVESFNGVVSAIFVFSPSTEDYAIVYEMLRDNPICYPLYFDSLNSFILRNSLPNGIFACLLNSSDSIVVRGNPINNEVKLMEYKETITSLVENCEE